MGTRLSLNRSAKGRARAGRAGAVALAAWLVACGGEVEQAGPQGPPPPAVEVQLVAPEDFTERGDLVGNLRAVDAVEIKAEIAGVIEAIAFEEGERVEKGAVLFRLRDDEQRARLAEATARVALAEDQFGRTERLARERAAAAAQLERHRAELEMARAQLSLARVELDRTRITAPFSGHIGRRRVSPGARIEPDDVLVRLDTIDPIDMETAVPEWALPLMQVGAHLDLEVVAYPGRKFPAVITFVAPSVEEAGRRVPIKARAENSEALLRPGMFADILVDLGRRDTILLPLEAVMNDADGAFVWRVGEGEVIERATVTVGARDGARVEVREGLVEGDRVVTAGTHKVFPGATVRAIEPTQSTASETSLQDAEGDGA